MNINPEKLHHSKWTATNPKNKEKHFIVTRVFRDDGHLVTDVELEAVLTKRVQKMSWRELKDDSAWQIGWL